MRFTQSLLEAFRHVVGISSDRRLVADPVDPVAPVADADRLALLGDVAGEIGGGEVAAVVGGGVHGADHGADGHPGWDLEYVNGADVLAAADGVVSSILADGSLPGAVTIQLSHHHASGEFRTVYGHLGAPAAGTDVSRRSNHG